MKVQNVGFKNCMKQKGKEAIMFYRLTGVILLISVLVFSMSANAQENYRAQIKGLDEQVQEIKTDVLSIAEQLNQLEEKLLYPSNTQVAVFISLAGDETFRLDAVEIELDGKPVAHHIYTFKELEALQKGGVQRIYTGNILAGSHELQVSVLGKSGGGNDFQKTELFTINKDVGPKIVEISLDPQSITFKDR
jgi:archaellum component FlaF (FlaF/FlaG flagellin family)